MQTDLQGRPPSRLVLLSKSGFAERGKLAYTLQAADAWRYMAQDIYART